MKNGTTEQRNYTEMPQNAHFLKTELLNTALFFIHRLVSLQSVKEIDLDSSYLP